MAFKKHKTKKKNQNINEQIRRILVKRRMFISKMEVNYIYIFKYEGKILSEKTNQNRILSILTSEKKIILFVY